MKAYVLEGINQLNYKEIKVPELHQGEVLVEVKAAGICGSDVPRIFETGTYHFPTIPGHEFSGQVVSAYDGEQNPWIGKRVGIFPLIPCMECFTCKKGEYEMCRNYNYLGSRCDGGFAEYVAVPEWNLIELPDKVSYEEAAMLEPAAVALHAVRRLDLQGVNTVALLGLGTIGILIAQWLYIFGVKQVYATGHKMEHGLLMKQCTSDSYKYCDASQMDVKQWLMEVTQNQGADVMIDCVSSSESVDICLSCVKPGGQVLVVGNPKADIQMNKDAFWKILRHQIRLTGTWNSTFAHEENDDWHMVLDACGKGDLKLKELITHKLPFDELEDGLGIMKDGTEYRNKVMIVKQSLRR